ncbi:MAG: hypothetical protein IPI00_01845 [Flavobacteriales bacterium]|nr:hypothetical protein [Flavobacteriales bacterium]
MGKAIDAILFIPLLLSGRNRKNVGNVAHGKLLPDLSEFIGMLLTFGTTLLAWVFFRAGVSGVDHDTRCVIKSIPSPPNLMDG